MDSQTCNTLTVTPRIVIADDSEVFRSGLVSILRLYPEFSVVAAAQDGEEALQLVEETNPDLLILDINMPKVDGWQVLRHLHQLNAPVRILVLTAHANPALRERALNNGATAWVSKGDIPLLIDTLHQLLAT